MNLENGHGVYEKNLALRFERQAEGSLVVKMHNVDPNDHKRQFYFSVRVEDETNLYNGRFFNRSCYCQVPPSLTLALFWWARGGSHRVCTACRGPAGACRAAQQLQQPLALRASGAQGLGRIAAGGRPLWTKRVKGQLPCEAGSRVYLP